ncbi:MAG: AAA family ATPase, partial [Candidatus Nealsonbacteria bacterium]|nr:AAA family ATPase [Candidatus Nealsonbacteria bacterium]
MELQSLEKTSKKTVQTHISKVFLTGKYAYKVKKPVNFGFLDFSDLKKRKFYCHQELKLNSRLSPEIYLKVVPITAEGRIIDFAVKMRQLSQGLVMENLLKSNRVSKEVLEKLARIIARFHQRAQNLPATKKKEAIRAVRSNWEENFQQTEEFVGKAIFRSDFEMIHKKIKD